VNDLTAAEIARQVRDGLAEPREIVQDYLARIAEADRGLGAFRVVRAEAALAEAEAVRRAPERATLPLAGVPVAVKDNVEVAGEARRNGSAASAETTSAADHLVVARLRAAGAVVVGLTNVPELCLVPVCDSAFGVARNPWNPARTPGGSSGGSAAAVAAGMVPLAHGNDGLGSIRIPAACCGLVGIKPGSGVVPGAADGAYVWDGLTENGPLATTVGDAALGLSVMAADPGLAELGDPGRLRIGVSIRSAQPGFPIDARYIAAVEAFADTLAELGHQVTRHQTRYPSWLGTGLLSSWYTFAHEDAAGLEPGLLQRRTRRMAAARPRLRRRARGRRLGQGALARGRGRAVLRPDRRPAAALARPAGAARGALGRTRAAPHHPRQHAGGGPVRRVERGRMAGHEPARRPRCRGHAGRRAAGGPPGR
jgi:amidase